MFSYFEKFLGLPDASSPERYIAVQSMKDMAVVSLNLVVIAAVVALVCLTPGLLTGILGGAVLSGMYLTDRLK